MTDEEKPVKPKRKSNSWTPERKEVNKSETIAIKKQMGEMAQKMKDGRPTDYNIETAKKFCQVISREPLSVEEICKKYPEEFPVPSCIFGWIADYPDFEEIYRVAKRTQMHLYVEQIIPISDHAFDDFIETPDGRRIDSEHIQRSKLRIDTRKWVASKLAPRVYGDTPKIDEKTSQETLLQLQDTIAALIKKNAKEY